MVIVAMFFHDVLSNGIALIFTAFGKVLTIR